MLVQSGGAPETLARNFAATVIGDWRAALAQPQAYVAQRIAQQRFIRAVHDWNRIATMWESWLRERADGTMHRPGIADRPAEAAAS
jgi:hypothetical protein